MPRWALLIFAVLLAAGAAGVTLYGLLHDSRQPAEETSAEPANAPATTTLPSNPTHTADLQYLLEAPQVVEAQQRLGFHNAYRDFFKRAPELSPEQRESEAEALSRQIDDYERRGELALSEALLLQVALIRATSEDEQQQKDRAAALVARYKALSAEREARDAQRQDANFERYKAEERRIVEEVLAMDDIPDGLSRDEYLRQRLQEAREQAYQ
ncbi:hypothetical protein [Zestomonas carbonaria]|uniref:Uncharacterized protein n=1 Tax=Zestomonas carbonaria TaxID=2762745 RepID=A0A7U7ERD0_9GAMM|nr:hypothetical protein [Pseudomonas carbonaria]CAD5109423.1 hypothetical protein PSEWESI4_03720 [Pseudomonas carbonaria]